ncbi:zinc-binding dehydrogenase, partial [Streptomyces sp. NPDC059627]
AVLIAPHRGAGVSGTASERNHDFVRGLGGEPVAYGPGLAERVRGLAAEGVDAVFDTVGGETLTVSANLLAPEGRMASIADPDVVDFGGRYCWARPDAEDLSRLAALAEQGAVTVHVAETFPLKRAADAHRRSQEGRTRGKLVVTVDWPEEG